MSWYDLVWLEDLFAFGWSRSFKQNKDSVTKKEILNQIYKSIVGADEGDHNHSTNDSQNGNINQR